MSKVVQSACPGCKKSLRIPVEWLHQSIRCKHCGMVLKAKQRATPAPVPAAPEPTVPLAEPVIAPRIDGRRRRKSGGWWKGPALALAVFGLVLAGFGGYHYRDRLAALLPPDDEPAKPDSRDVGAAKQTPPKTTKSAKAPPKNAPHPGSNIFPRRALIISIHDYLYANPLQSGMPGTQANLNNFINSLNVFLHVPLNQIAHLSDDAGKQWGPRAPTKTVIEKTLTNFLDSSRPQDRILVFFLGHAVEVGDDVYLAPIEGELDRAETLIPLKWFYEQLAKCKARQKVLVLDGNRYNQTLGQERQSGGEEMGPKLDAMLKAPPPGVQVWSSCIAKQRSFASDGYPMGIFLDSLQKALRQGGKGKIQKPDEELPLAHYVELVNKFMKNDLSKRKLEQVSRLTGKEADTGAAYDPKQKAPPNAKAALARPPAGVEENKKLVEAVLDQIGTPPIKVKATHELPISYDALPPFSAEMLKKFQDDPNSPLRQPVQDARAMLWAIYPDQPPSSLKVEVALARRNYPVQLSVLKDGYPAPSSRDEAQFKKRVENDERHVAMLMRAVEDALMKLREPKVVEARENEKSKRWQANYDFMLARVEMQYAYLFEYQSMLGSMRKEFPPRNPELHSRWKLASQPKLQGDSIGKKSAKDAQKLLDKIIKNNTGSPWEVLAKREKLTNLGLEWQPAK